MDTPILVLGNHPTSTNSVDDSISHQLLQQTSVHDNLSDSMHPSSESERNAVGLGSSNIPLEKQNEILGLPPVKAEVDASAKASRDSETADPILLSTSFCARHSDVVGGLFDQQIRFREELSSRLRELMTTQKQNLLQLANPSNLMDDWSKQITSKLLPLFTRYTEYEIINHSIDSQLKWFTMHFEQNQQNLVTLRRQRRCYQQCAQQSQKESKEIDQQQKKTQDAWLQIVPVTRRPIFEELLVSATKIADHKTKLIQHLLDTDDELVIDDHLISTIRWVQLVFKLNHLIMDILHEVIPSYKDFIKYLNQLSTDALYAVECREYLELINTMGTMGQWDKLDNHNHDFFQRSKSDLEFLLVSLSFFFPRLRYAPLLLNVGCHIAQNFYDSGRHNLSSLRLPVEILKCLIQMARPGHPEQWPKMGQIEHERLTPLDHSKLMNLLEAFLRESRSPAILAAINRLIVIEFIILLRLPINNFERLQLQIERLTQLLKDCLLLNEEKSTDLSEMLKLEKDLDIRAMQSIRHHMTLFASYGEIDNQQLQYHKRSRLAQKQDQKKEEDKKCSGRSKEAEYLESLLKETHTAMEETMVKHWKDIQDFINTIMFKRGSFESQHLKIVSDLQRIRDQFEEKKAQLRNLKQTVAQQQQAIDHEQKGCERYQQIINRVCDESWQLKRRNAMLLVLWRVLSDANSPNAENEFINLCEQFGQSIETISLSTCSGLDSAVVTRPEEEKNERVVFQEPFEIEVVFQEPIESEKDRAKQETEMQLTQIIHPLVYSHAPLAYSRAAAANEADDEGEARTHLKLKR